jgi:hypothetical protein
MNSIPLLDKIYDGESICDISRDVHEAFIADFTPNIKNIPVNEDYIQKGSFRVLIVWNSDE